MVWNKNEKAGGYFAKKRAKRYPKIPGSSSGQNFMEITFNNMLKVNVKDFMR